MKAPANYLQRLMLLLLVVAVGSPVSAQIIPDDRTIHWDPGVRGDIPTNRTQCGSAITPSGGNDSTAIQDALSTCGAGKYVLLGPGTFRLNSTLDIPDHTTLRGSGKGTTILQGQPGASPLVQMQPYPFNYDFAGSTARELNGGLVKGSTQITTSAPHGWSVGDMLFIDELANSPGAPPVIGNDVGEPIITNAGYSGYASFTSRANGTRPNGQMVKVVAVPTATTITFTPALDYAYRLAPQGIRMTGQRTGAGVEDVTLDNTLSASQDVVHIYFTNNSWLSNTEIIGSSRRAVDMFGAMWVTIRGCSIHGGIPNTPGPGSQYGSNRAYGVYLGPYVTASLVENNELYSLSFAVSLEGAISGNVVAYNYVHDLYYINDESQRTAIGHHGAHSKYTLIEGNYIKYAEISADSYWGSASHTTVFRNRVQNMPSGYVVWALFIQCWHDYFNVVGNVLGASTDQVYELSETPFDQSTTAVYNLGYMTSAMGSASGYDATVKATMLRHGNYDYVNGSVIWDGAISDHSLPPSLYLASKPTWWGNLAWPAIGPDLSPMFPVLPAGGGTPWSNTTSVVPPPKDLRVR